MVWSVGLLVILLCGVCMALSKNKSKSSEEELDFDQWLDKREEFFDRYDQKLDHWRVKDRCRLSLDYLRQAANANYVCQDDPWEMVTLPNARACTLESSEASCKQLCQLSFGNLMKDSACVANQERTDRYSDMSEIDNTADLINAVIASSNMEPSRRNECVCYICPPNACPMNYILNNGTCTNQADGSEMTPNFKNDVAIGLMLNDTTEIVQEFRNAFEAIKNKASTRKFGQSCSGRRDKINKHRRGNRNHRFGQFPRKRTVTVKCPGGKPLVEKGKPRNVEPNEHKYFCDNDSEKTDIELPGDVCGSKPSQGKNKCDKECKRVFPLGQNTKGTICQSTYDNMEYATRCVCKGICVPNKCPDNWYLRGGSCFHVAGRKLYSAAKSYCESLNSTLPMIKTAGQFMNLKGFMKSHGGKKTVWLGLKIPENETNNKDITNFIWVDGTKLTGGNFGKWAREVPWLAPNPDNRNSLGRYGAKCVRADASQAYFWLDDSCEKTNPGAGHYAACIRQAAIPSPKVDGNNNNDEDLVENEEGSTSIEVEVDLSRFYQETEGENASSSEESKQTAPESSSEELESDTDDSSSAESGESGKSEKMEDYEFYDLFRIARKSLKMRSKFEFLSRNWSEALLKEQYAAFMDVFETEEEEERFNRPNKTKSSYGNKKPNHNCKCRSKSKKNNEDREDGDDGADSGVKPDMRIKEKKIKELNKLESVISDDCKYLIEKDSQQVNGDVCKVVRKCMKGSILLGLLDESSKSKLMLLRAKCEKHNKKAKKNERETLKNTYKGKMTQKYMNQMARELTEVPECVKPENWFVVGQKKVHFSKSEKSWKHARTHCGKCGAKLFINETATEWDFLKTNISNIVTKSRKGKFFWIGLKADSAGEFAWPDNIQATTVDLPVVSKLYNLSLKMYKSMDTCGVVFPAPNAFYVDHRPCRMKFRYVCQKNI